VELLLKERLYKRKREVNWSYKSDWFIRLIKVKIINNDFNINGEKWNK